MMRLLILSDLHLEHRSSYQVPDDLEYDVVVLAGDIHNPGVRAVRWAADPATFGGRPVVFVAGNHEFYRTEMSAELSAMRRAAEGTPVHVLSRDAVVVEGVRFLGATLWTDFALPIADEGGLGSEHLDSNIERALRVANGGLNDFVLIERLSTAAGGQRDGPVRRLLCAEDTLAMHWVDRDWLRRELEWGHPGPTVVVTHHAPHHHSVSFRYRSDWLTPAFVNDLPEPFFEGVPMWVAGRKVQDGGPVLWVHGHTHSPFDYQVGGCRVVSNPRGYAMRDSSWENARFNPGFIVEVASE